MTDEDPELTPEQIRSAAGIWNRSIRDKKYSVSVVEDDGVPYGLVFDMDAVLDE